MRNMNRTLNKKRPIEHMMEVNIYYQGYKKRIKIDMIGGQKWSVILGMLWFVHHNSEINWRIGEVKITRYTEKYRKQWRLKQEKTR